MTSGFIYIVLILRDKRCCYTSCQEGGTEEESCQELRRSQVKVPLKCQSAKLKTLQGHIDLVDALDEMASRATEVEVILTL